jgi:uncharacterized protein YndB with AHSA1/START domain
MIMVTHRQIIEQPVERVFAFAANPENNPQWWATVLEAELASEGPLQPGSRFRELGQGPLGKIESLFEVTAYQPGKQAQYRVIKGPIPAEVTETFAAANGGTELTVRVTVQPRGLLWLLQPLLGRMIDKNWQDNLNQLKKLLEDTAS